MNCQDIDKRLDAWVDGELSASAVDRLTHHLENCPACRYRAQVLREMVDALDRLPAVPAPSALFRQTLKAYRRGIHRPGMAEWWQHLSLMMRSAVCGAALAGLLCGAVLGTSLVTLVPSAGTSPYQTLYASEGFYP